MNVPSRRIEFISTAPTELLSPWIISLYSLALLLNSNCVAVVRKVMRATPTTTAFDTTAMINAVTTVALLCFRVSDNSSLRKALSSGSIAIVSPGILGAVSGQSHNSPKNCALLSAIGAF